MAKSELERRQAVNKATANVIPVILIGIVGYATWVVIVLVAGHNNRLVTLHAHGLTPYPQLTISSTPILTMALPVALAQASQSLFCTLSS